MLLKKTQNSKEEGGWKHENESVRQHRERQDGVNEESNAWTAGFDSWMLISTGTISLMEGAAAAAGQIKETESDGPLICTERTRERDEEGPREKRRPA